MARGNTPGGLVCCRLQLRASLFRDPGCQRVIVVVATQCRVAAGGDHFEHAMCKAQHRDIEGTATQIVDGVDPLCCVIQTVGNGCRRGFVDQAQQIDAGQLGRILGGLTLGIVKVRGHGDDGAIELVIKRVFGAETQGRQDFGADFHGRLGAVRSLDGDNASVLGLEAIRQLLGRLDIGQAAPHKALGRTDGVGGILRLSGLGIEADLAAAHFHVAHHRRQQHTPLIVRQAFSHAIAHGGDQRVRGAQVDTHGNASLMGIGGLAGLGNLQKRHEILLLKRLRPAWLARSRWIRHAPWAQSVALGLIVPVDRDGDPHLAQIAQQT